MWWHGRYPGYQDEDFATPFEELQREGTDRQILEDVRALLANPEPDDYVRFTPVGPVSPSPKDYSKKRKPYNGEFRLTNTDAPLVKETLEANGFGPATNQHDWLLQWSGPNLRDCVYSGLHQFQRVNHFPGSTELTRKDRLWVHYQAMQKAFGKAYYDFMPDTYVLPDQLEEFLAAYEKQDCFWIVKPTASSRGRGIFLLRDLEEMPTDSCIVCAYVDRPMLIQGLKYDLRLYVLVTGFDPLRIYIYREGLTRFASSTFSCDTEDDLKDVYKHLTNYSVNKFANNFVENQDANLDNFGHKWSVSALNKHLRCIGVDVESLWSRILGVVIKTLLCTERTINNQVRNLVMWRQNCFELYGFDILLDEELKPWLLEVNLSPSMQADSPLDRRIKAHLLAEALSMVRLRPCDNKTLGQARWRARTLQMRRRMHPPTTRPQSCPDRTIMQKGHKEVRSRKSSLSSLSEKHLRLLADMLAEFSIAQNFIRIFPTHSSVKRYGYMLAPSNNQGKLTATQALINLLFNEKRGISNDVKDKRPRTPLFHDERLHNQSADFVDYLFGEKGKGKTRYAQFGEDVHGGEEESRRMSRRTTQSTVNGEEEQEEGKNEGKRCFSRPGFSSTASGFSTFPSLRSSRDPHRARTPKGKTTSSFQNAAHELQSTEVAEVLERYEKRLSTRQRFNRLVPGGAGATPSSRGTGTAGAGITVGGEVLPSSPDVAHAPYRSDMARDTLNHSCPPSYHRRPRTAEGMRSPIDKPKFNGPRREPRTTRPKVSPACVPSFYDIEL